MDDLDLRTTTLNAGLSVLHPAAENAELLYAQVEEYFSHGLEETVSPGATVFDVGANIGLFTLEVLRRTNGEARVFAFEPIPTVAKVLKENVERNGWADAVEVFPQAVGREAGTVQFEYRPNATVTSSMYSMEDHFDKAQDPDALKLLRDERAPEELRKQVPWIAWYLPRPILRWILRRMWDRYRRSVSVTCPIQPLSEFFTEHGIDRIDLLKVDVEKAEADVLAGIRDEHWPLIRALAVEVHDEEGRLEAMTGLLEKQGFGAIVTEQEWLFEQLGTGVYGLYARRTDD